MVKKYTDNYRLDIAYATIFRSLKTLEEIPIHTALDITSGDNLTKKDMVPGAHIVYGGGGETGNTHSEFNIDYKTIGIGRVGARCGCVFEIIPNSWVTDNALIIQSYDKRFSLSFLRHFLSYSDLGQYANNAMQPVISKTRINDVTIPLIDIEEQNTLSKILDSIEKNEKFESNDYDLLKSKIEIIDNWETLIVEIEIQKDLTAQLKQSILQEAIQGKLTADWRTHNPNTEPAIELLKRIKAEKAQLIKDKKIKKDKALPPITEDEISFELPVGWVWSRLIEICTKLTDGFHHTPKKIDSGNIYISPKNLKNNKVIWSSCDYIDKKDHDYLHKKVNTTKGDILIANRGTVGTPAIVDIDEQFSFQNLALIGFNQEEISSKYIYYYLLSKQKGILDFFANGGLQPMLSNKVLKTLPLPLPCLEEQNAIVEKVETLMQKCETLEDEIKTSEAHAQILMQAVLKEAFEGNREVIYES